MTKKISGSEYSLAKIFSSDFEYHIPSYQRPYAWTMNESSELFDDLYDFFQTEDNEGYFLGSIVLIKKLDEPYSEVIDGQQRLTTLTILLATVCSIVPDKTYRNSVENYINEPGNEPEGRQPQPRLFLRDKDKEFFKKYVQNFDFDMLQSIDPQNLDGESQRNIQNNSKFFIKRLHEKFDSNYESLKRFITFLVTRCFLVVVSTPDQQSAFRVFSIMNSRGLNLQPTDIIKADIIGKISEDKRDEYSNKWEEIENSLGREGFNDLFSFIRMIYAKERAKKSLLEEFRLHVIDVIRDPEYFVKDVLEPYANVLAIVKQSDYRASSQSDALEVNGYLRWLNRIDNSDWIPSAIYFLLKYKDNSRIVSLFFKKLERLGAYLHVCSKNINLRIQRYAEIITRLEKDGTSSSAIHAAELTEGEKLNMKNILNSNVYELTSRRRNYIILRLDSFISDGAAFYDPKMLTVEHVLPQSVMPGSEWARIWPEEEKRKEWVHRISNLVPLNKQRNSRAQNYDFTKKKEAYFKGSKNVSSYVLTTDVLNTESWTEEVLIKRQAVLLERMCEMWDLKEAS